MEKFLVDSCIFEISFHALSNNYKIETWGSRPEVDGTEVSSGKGARQMVGHKRASRYYNSPVIYNTASKLRQRNMAIPNDLAFIGIEGFRNN